LGKIDEVKLFVNQENFWKPQPFQQKAIEESSKVLEAEEVVIKAWDVLHINNMDLEQVHNPIRVSYRFLRKEL
jgi:hypothetical protein